MTMRSLSFVCVAEGARAKHAEARSIARSCRGYLVGATYRETRVMMAWFLGLILAPFNDIKLRHLVFNLPFKVLEVDYQLVSILIESRSVLPRDESVDLQLLVNDSLDLLHGL